MNVSEFMSSSPHTIGPEATLCAAHALMRTHRIRHLPVTQAGELVGLVSERDLLRLEGVPGVKPSMVLVEEAMTEDPMSLSPATSLEWVAAAMAERRLGSTVIVEDGKVVGVFTTTDALRALQELLAWARRKHSPSRARKSPKSVTK